MKKNLLLFSLYIAFFTVLNAAEVTAELSQKEVVAGNTVQLRIKATGGRAAFPDIQQIEGVRVQGRSQTQNNSISYINGTMSNTHTTSLILTFSPQKDMTVPSYGVNIDGMVYKTKPMKIKVVKASAPGVASNMKYSLQMRADKKVLIVGEPLVVTVYFSLKTGVRLAENPDYDKPVFNGFFVKEVNEPRSYIKGDQQIQELRYVLTAKQEGNFTVGPATARIAEVDRNRRDMFGRFFGSNWKTIASNTVTIAVKPKPEDTDLVGDFTLESHLDHNKVKANKPINLSIKITGEGSLEDLELPNVEIDGVTIYSDDPSITTNLSNNSVHSTYTKSFVFISDHDFTIPARRISVYDTKSKTVKTLEVPSYDVHVEGSPQVAAVQKPQAQKPPVGQVQTNLNVPQKQKSMLDIKDDDAPKEVPSTSWWMIVLAFVSGMFVIALVKMLPKMKRGKSTRNYTESEALKILYAHINESSKIEAMVRKLYAKKNGDKSIVIDKKELKKLLEKYGS